MIIDINTLKIKSTSELTLINKNKMLIPPIKEPKITLFKLAFLFNIRLTARSNKKSKKKFKMIIKSTYIFISTTRNKYKKRHVDIVSS